MKNRFALILIVSLISCSNAFGDWSDTAGKMFDKLNYFTDHMLSLKEAPGFKEVLNKNGKIGSWHHVPKTIITALITYLTFKNETVRTVVGKVAAPVKRAMGMDKKTTKRKREMLKKRAEDWEKEEAA